jgi:hypothetical protein
VEFLSDWLRFKESYTTLHICRCGYMERGIDDSVERIGRVLDPSPATFVDLQAEHVS